MPVKVQKKDGLVEDFDRNKVINGLLRSGATQEEAENVAILVEGWLVTAAVNGVVQSADVRTKVLEVLQTVNAAAASNYEAYRKPTAATEPAQTVE